ncbi:glycosyltransferase [Azospirillum sp. INR13]|uniref:glycosyltransferase family protein n=1 Tax=Azospirillum sp. INR13 TaxID=2596919 RepID=UPI0021063404|nr:glycosyltransferase [Azospirillum sp. INR13]
MQIHTFYDAYLGTFYERRPELRDAPFASQIGALLEDGFSGSHLVAPHMGQLGHQTQLVIANCVPAQFRWAQENGVPVPRTGDDLYRLVARQVEAFRPEILYVTDPILFDSRFLRGLSWKPRFVAGWRAASIPQGTDWSAFDLMLSSDEGCRRRALELGARAVEPFRAGFPAFLADAVADQPKQWDVVFSGQGSAEHLERLRGLVAVARASDRGRNFSFGCFLANADPALLPEELRFHLQPAVWAKDMLRTLRSGRIVLNSHIDLVAHRAQNMRLFEATGVGSFLLTEESDALADLFEPGVEVGTYRDHEDMLRAIRHHLDNPEEREAIARRGQERCLRDYGMVVYARNFDRLVRDGLMRRDAATAATPSPVPNLSVAIVNSFENFGGAAQAANRLHRALRADGVDSRMLVRERATDDPTVIQAAPTDPAARQAFATRFRDRLGPSAALHMRPERGYFSLDIAERGASLLAGLTDAARPPIDLVNLHWVADFLDWELFFQPGNAARPVVWTLHDMRPFTGGCHYAFDCNGFTAGCGRCPNIDPKDGSPKNGSGDPNDATHRMLERQCALLAGWGGHLHLVAPSRWLAGEAARSTLFAGRPVSVIPNSVDIQAFRPIAKAEARARLGLPADGRLLLFVGHDVLEPRKGYGHLRQALPALSGGPVTRLLTVGKGRPPADSPIPHMHLNGTDSSETLNLAYAAADLLVLPTLQDNLPNTVLEAFASGTPVAGFAVGGVPEHVLPDRTGALVPTGDGAALGALLRRLVEAPDHLAELGREARNHAEREFAPAVQARRYRDLFAGILAMQGKGRDASRPLPIPHDCRP